MAITVINFTHPLSQEATKALPGVLGASPQDITVHNIPVHVHDMRDVRTNVRTLLNKAEGAAGGNPWDIDCIIPPGHGLIAATLAYAMTFNWGYLPHLIIMERAPDTVPPQWLPVGIVRGGNLSR